MWKIWFALTWLLVESMGVPLLSEGAFGPLSAAVHYGQISLAGAYLAAYLAVIAGNALGFFAFYFYGPGLIRWLTGRWPTLKEKIERAEPRIRTQVYLVMGIARFVGLGTFGVVLWVAGMLRTPWKPFLLYLFALDLIWTGAWLFGSHFLVGVVLAWLKELELSTAILYGALGVAAYFALHHLIKLGMRYWRNSEAE